VGEAYWGQAGPRNNDWRPPCKHPAECRLQIRRLTFIDEPLRALLVAFRPFSQFFDGFRIDFLAFWLNRPARTRFHTPFRLRGLGVQRETSYQPLGRSDEGRMSSLISEETVAFVSGVAAEARRVETPCGNGHMVWHLWGDGPPLALLHGGYGSWTHWIRNVIPLSRAFSVAAPDLPGLGESATPPEPHTAEGLARIVVEGLDIVFRGQDRLHIAGFSFGGVLGGHVAAQLGDRVGAFTIVGSNGLGLVRQPTALQRLAEDAAEADAFAVARHNLAALMIADPGKIDELAVYIQAQNAPRGRVKSRRFSRADTLARALPLIKARIDGIWGERDATAYPHLDDRARALRHIQPDARFEVIPGAGHWVQYEAADRFNPLLANIAARGRIR
jgi:2-hydroxy-6-oxonona-2,4-dienedioate hydrolase